MQSHVVTLVLGDSNTQHKAAAARLIAEHVKAT